MLSKGLSGVFSSTTVPVQTTCLYSRQLFGYLLTSSFPFPITLPPPHSDIPPLCVCPGGVISSSHLPIKYIWAFLSLCTVWTAPYASFLRGLYHSPLGSLRSSWASVGEPRAFFPSLVLLVRMCSPGPLLSNSPCLTREGRVSLIICLIITNITSYWEHKCIPPYLVFRWGHPASLLRV